MGPMAPESESRPELESARVDRFAWSRNWSWQNFADSDSDPESQDTNRQRTMILAERPSIVPKTLKLKKKMRVAVVEIKLKHYS